jgi:osomolarity two-component system response regulator SSK1
METLCDFFSFPSLLLFFALLFVLEFCYFATFVDFLLTFIFLICRHLTSKTYPSWAKAPTRPKKNPNATLLLFPPLENGNTVIFMMPDRISRLKAKFLGRLPSKTDTDPVHPNNSVDSKSPAYSIVSSPNIEVTTTDLQIEESPHEPDSFASEQHHRERTDCTSLTEPYNSSLPTPLSGDPPSPLESPLPTPQHSDNTSFQSKKTITEPQLSPTLNTVIERPNDRPPATDCFTPSSSKRPSLAVRRQSLLPATHQHLIGGLLEGKPLSSGDRGPFIPAIPQAMVQRRIWVKRPGGSATLVPCMEDAVVDELRDQVIMKYVNSLGRSFDSPDIVIRIAPREGSNRQSHPERLLSPEESLASIIDSYYPGGQRIEEALVIDAPARRTPKPSPRHSVYSHHHSEPGEHGDYFPLMPPNPNVGTPSSHPAVGPATVAAPSISILTTGSAPQLPSPGSRRTRHHQRPPLTRHKTNSPTVHTQNSGATGTF